MGIPCRSIPPGSAGCAPRSISCTPPGRRGGCARSGWPAPLQCARSAVWLDVAARRSVHALKYGGLPRIADHLAAAAARVTLPLPARRAAALVPVPLGPRRLRARGYNQSALLAHGLGTRWGLPVAELLVRTRETATQTALTPGSRLANVAGGVQEPEAESRRRHGSPLSPSAAPIC